MEFILLLLSFLLLSSRATSSSDAVLDSDGNELQSGQLYYAESVYSRGGAGGLRMESPQGQRCPLYVAKGSFNDVKGQPLMFFPENKKDDIVRVERTLYIKFAEPTPCAESTTWRLDNNNNAVVTGGTTSSKVGPHDSRFALYRTNLGYKIRPCPCSNGVNRPSCRMECSGHLGVVEGKLERQLGVNDIPHEFRLTPAKRGEIEFVTRSEV